jgi:hypothetical protein
LSGITRYLNGFIVIGVVLAITGVAGLATGNRLLTEPGQPINPYSWLLYIGAAAVMIVNGLLSIKLAMRPHDTDEAEAAKAGESSRTSEPARR